MVGLGVNGSWLSTWVQRTVLEQRVITASSYFNHAETHSHVCIKTSLTDLNFIDFDLNRGGMF